MQLGIPFEDRIYGLIFWGIVLVSMLGYYKFKEYKMKKSRNK